MMNVDYVNIDNDELPLQPNGFLNILANVTRTGVFTYMEKTPDGTVRVIKQLRHPDEVFAEATLATLMGLPTTNLHPMELVSPDNAKELVVGMTSDTPKKISLDNDPEEYIQQQVTFFDSSAIQQIKNGERRELSLGYVCELDETPGEWNGMHYDYIQRGISYNHLSLVDRARGGAQCKVITDSNEEIICDGLSFLTNQEIEMKVFIADGKEFKVEDNIYDLLKGMDSASAKAQNENSSLQSEHDKLKANLDTLKAKFDEEDSKENKAKADKVFKDAVEARVLLESKAKTVLGDAEEFAGLEARAIKEKVINKIHPGLKLDVESDVYVDASFDIAVKGYKPPTEEDKMGKKMVADAGGDDDGYSASRQKAWNRDQELWKKTSIK